jgi:putative transcriptional regulator
MGQNVPSVARPAPYAFLVGGDPQDGHPAARIQQLRAGLGPSQEQLARQLGVSFATVNRWESGRTQMSARASRALAEFEARAAADRSSAGLPVNGRGTAPPRPVGNVQALRSASQQRRGVVGHEGLRVARSPHITL